MRHILHPIWSGGNPDNCLCALHHVFDLRAGYCFCVPSHPSKIMKCVFGYVLRTPARNSDPSRGCIFGTLKLHKNNQNFSESSLSNIDTSFRLSQSPPRHHGSLKLPFLLFLHFSLSQILRLPNLKPFVNVLKKSASKDKKQFIAAHLQQDFHASSIQQWRTARHIRKPLFHAQLTSLTLMESFPQNTNVPLFLLRTSLKKYGTLLQNSPLYLPLHPLLLTVILLLLWLSSILFSDHSLRDGPLALTLSPLKCSKALPTYSSCFSWITSIIAWLPPLPRIHGPSQRWLC